MKEIIWKSENLFLISILMLKDKNLNKPLNHKINKNHNPNLRKLKQKNSKHQKKKPKKKTLNQLRKKKLLKKQNKLKVHLLLFLLELSKENKSDNLYLKSNKRWDRD